MEPFTKPSRSQWRSVLGIAETVLILAAAIFIIVGSARSGGASGVRPPIRPESPLPKVPLSPEGAMTKGSPSARVALIEYSDFQCPFCGRFVRDTLPTLERRYVDTGKVLLVFRQRPLPIHPFAEKAAEADVCAARQGKGWEMHDLLFQDQAHLDTASLGQRAKQLGLEGSAFDSCLAGDAAGQVKTDAVGADAAHITGTPGFFVGAVGPDGTVVVSKRLNGALPVEQFSKVLDPLVKLAAVGR